MNHDVVSILYSSLHFVLLSSARYWLYRDSLRIPEKWIYTIISVIAFGTSGLWIFSGGIPGMSFNNFRIILAVLAFSLSCFIIREPIAKHAFAYAFIFAYDAALEATASFIQLGLSFGNSSIVYVITLSLLLLITFVPAIRILKQMVVRLSALENDKIWSYLCLCCFSFLLMNLLFTLPQPSDINILHPLSRYLMLLGMVGMYAAAVRMMESIRRSTETSANLQLSEHRLEMQESYYDRLVTQVNEVRRIRHDLRHHWTTLAALAKSGNIDAVTEYLNAVSSTDPPLHFTGNLAADSILMFCSDEAKNLHIPLECDVAILKAPLPDPDLCVILGNLLENAIDAQRYLNPEERYIRVTAASDSNSLVLSVENRYDGTLVQDSGNYISRKSGEGHGIGIASVRAVCEKYDGILQIETDGDTFLAGVVIGI